MSRFHHLHRFTSIRHWRCCFAEYLQNNRHCRWFLLEKLEKGKFLSFKLHKTKKCAKKAMTKAREQRSVRSQQITPFECAFTHNSGKITFHKIAGTLPIERLLLSLRLCECWVLRVRLHVWLVSCLVFFSLRPHPIISTFGLLLRIAEFCQLSSFWIGFVADLFIKKSLSYIIVIHVWSKCKHFWPAVR